MAEPSSPLQHPVIRAFRSVIRRGFEEGLSRNAILRAIRNQGGQIRRQTGLQALAVLDERYRAETRLRFLPLNLRPDPLRLPESFGRIRDNFSFTVGVNRLPLPGKPQFEQYLTITTSTLRTRAELELAAQEFIETREAYAALGFRNVLLLGGVRAGPAGLI